MDTTPVFVTLVGLCGQRTILVDTNVCRWKEALDAGKAPPIVLESCSEEALKVVSIEQLKQHVLQTAQ